MIAHRPARSAAAPLSTILVTALAPAAWGTTYLVTTELLPPDRPILAALLRVLPIGIVLTAASRRLPTGRWWWRSAVLGLLNIGVFQVLLFVAAHRLPGGVAATAGAIQPLVVAALAAWLLGEPLRRRTVWAGVGGMVGVGLLVLTPQAVLDPVGVAAALVGTTVSAAGVVLTKRWGRPAGLLAVTGWQLVAGGLAILPLSLIVEGPPPVLDARGWAGVAWLAVVGTGVAYTLWFRGIERLPVSQVSFLALISPLVATAIGWVVLGQSLSVGQLAGAALIAATVVATQRRADRRPAPAVGPETDVVPTRTKENAQVC